MVRFPISHTYEKDQMNPAPTPPPPVSRQALHFRSAKIIYYGPHPCDNCGVIICKTGREFGGNAFTYPDGPIYPNTEWQPHICHPENVEAWKTRPVVEQEPPTSTPRLDPTPQILNDPLFDAVWERIKGWDINVPGIYTGYTGATGNHVRAILDAVRAAVPAAYAIPAIEPMPAPPAFKGATCRGSFVFGSACGNCERCDWERKVRRDRGETLTQNIS